MESDYPEFSVTNSEANCKQIIGDLQKYSMEKMAIELKRSEDLSTYASCVMDDLRVDLWMVDILLEKVYGASETLPAAEKQTKIDEVVARSRLNFLQTILTCFAMENFGSLFDEMIEDNDNSSEDEGDYCLKKHVIDKKLIDNSIYSLDPNPLNHDVSDIDCRVVLKEIVKVMERTLTKKYRKNPKKSRCVLSKYRQVNYIDRYLVIVALSGLKITEEQKQNERKIFIDSSVALINSVSVCG